MIIEVISDYKSIPRNIAFEIPDFCVLTGRNGSGKTHLLQTITDTTKSNVLIKNQKTNKILYIGFNELNSIVEEESHSTSITHLISSRWETIEYLLHSHKGSNLSDAQFLDSVWDKIARNPENEALISTLKSVMHQAEKALLELTVDDFYRHVNFVESTSESLLFTKCATVFKAYQLRKLKNDLAGFQAEKQDTRDAQYLNNIEFTKKYGPAPWDILNELLKEAHLPYQVSKPNYFDFELPYRFRMIDVEKGIEISANDLSSGEKVIMSLVLATYNTIEGGARPDLLLLDEPDAALHPQYSKLLIKILTEVIIQKGGIKVIMTTHSPATIAMAPDDCVFEIDSTSKIPFMVSNARAIRTLTEGVNFLRVSSEQRRQVFVESKYDVQYFESLFNIISRSTEFSYQPIFLEPHSGTSNCTDVQAIVRKLRAGGNDLVWGIIDYDTKNKQEDNIVILGNSARYAIENYILDPLYICLSLIRYAKNKYSDFGLNSNKITYTDAAKLTQQECQTMIDSFLNQIGIPIQELQTIQLTNGFELNYPSSFLFYHGHQYETKIKESFLSLGALSKGKADSALKLAVLQIIGEYPQFLPVEISNTFTAILGHDTYLQN